MFSVRRPSVRPSVVRLHLLRVKQFSLRSRVISIRTNIPHVSRHC